MVRSAARFRPLLLACVVALASTCAPDDQGIRRLPLEPEASPGVLSLTPSASSLGWIGAGAQLTARVAGADGTPAKDFRYTWRSLDEGVVTVDGTGRITAVTEGTATIVATVMNLADTATVTVQRIPAAVILTEDSLLFTLLGAGASVGSTVVDGGGVPLTSSAVAWTSSDTTVVTVSASGGVLAVRQGRATLTARAGGVSNVVVVRVSVGPSSVSVAPAGLAFDALGDSTQLVPTVKDAAGGILPGVPVTYAVTDSTVASVTAGGLVRSLKTGSTQVVARADSVSRVVAISVTQKVTSVVVAPDSTTLIPGATVALTAALTDRNGYPISGTLPTWASADTAVAQVGSTGVVTAMGTPGTVTVTATAKGVVGTATITVVDVPVSTVEIEPTSVSLAPGAAATLNVTFRAADGTVMVGPQAIWSSDDPAVATVSAQGKVTAVAEGMTWIHATVDDSLAATDSASVTVTAPVAAFDIEVRFVGGTPTSGQQAAYAAAEARWESLLIGDLGDVPVTVTSACGLAGANLNETVDDLIIFATVAAIDGSGGILGQAGPCLVRSAGGLAIVGQMQFDEADLADLEASGDLNAVITHEMGHVLGLGASTPWDDVLVAAGEADPYWPGAAAVARYDSAGGPATNKVPVANTGGEGTRDAHWRESDMGAELMTGYINSGATMPLSAITVGAMEDMGYQVDMAEADIYTVSAALRVFGPVFQLRELPMPKPGLVTPEGRIVRPSVRLR